MDIYWIMLGKEGMISILTRYKGYSKHPCETGGCLWGDFEKAEALYRPTKYQEVVWKLELVRNEASLEVYLQIR